MVPTWWQRAARGAVATLAVCLPLSLSGMELALGVMMVLAAIAVLCGYRAWSGSPLDIPLLVVLAVFGTSPGVAGPSCGALVASRGLWSGGT